MEHWLVKTILGSKALHGLVEYVAGLALVVLACTLDQRARWPLYVLLAVFLAYTCIAASNLARQRPWAPRCKEPCDCGCGRPCVWAMEHEGKHQS